MAKIFSDRPLESVNDFITRARKQPSVYSSANVREWIIFGKLTIAAAIYDDISSARYAEAYKFHASGDYKALMKMNDELAEKYGDHIWTHKNIDEGIAAIHANKGN